MIKKITQAIFKLNDQTIAMISLLLIIDILSMVYMGWKITLVIIGAILLVPLLIKFLFNPIIQLIAILRKMTHE